MFADSNELARAPAAMNQSSVTLRKLGVEAALMRDPALVVANRSGKRLEARQRDPSGPGQIVCEMGPVLLLAARRAVRIVHA